MKLGAFGAKLFAGKVAAVKTAVVLTGAIVMEAGVVTTYKIVNEGPDIALGVEQIDDTSTQSSSNPSDNQDFVTTPGLYIPDRQQERSTYQPPK
ncbi:MAG: hypothetical protein GY869_04540 [Planctomycetes bacterium]|nr:hypothetical protein [Planctomycetota bacterium]